MLEVSRTLDYLAKTAALGAQGTVPFDDEASWEVSVESVRTGVLEPELTQALFEAYSAAHPDVVFGQRKIATLFGFIPAQDDDARLFVPALVGSDGTLERMAGTRPWIALDQLEGDLVHGSSHRVCDLDSYRAHQTSMEALASDGSWEVALSRAFDLYDAVSAVAGATEQRSLADAGTRCKVRVFEHLDEHLAASHALSALAAKHELRGGEGTGAPIMALLSDDVAPQQDNQIDPANLDEEGLFTYKLVCGLLAELPTLADHDRQVVANLSRHASDALTVIAAPKGTGGLSVAVARVANQLCEQALRGDQLASSAIVAPADEIRRLIAWFESRPAFGQVSLPVRWLPRIAPGTEATSERRILGPLGAVMMVHVDDACPDLASHVALTHPFLHPRGGQAAAYAEGWYLPQAKTYYLDCVSSYLGSRVRDLREARQRLSERLRLIDQLRCELIDSYFEVCRADGHMRQRDEIVERLGHLRRKHTQCRSRLGHWEEVRRRHPQRLSRLGGIKLDQSQLIARSAQEGEIAAQGKTDVEDVCRHYRDELDAIESEIDRLRVSSQQLSRRVRAAQPEGERCTEIVGRLSSLCRLDATQQGQLDTAIDGSVVSLSRFDAVLDQTVRASEFWLAVHIFEAQWFDAAERLVATEQPQDPSWTAWSYLCPLQLVCAECATAILGEQGLLEGCDWKYDEVAHSMRLDQLVVTSAHRLTQAQGMALLGSARHALLVGSPVSLGAPALFGHTFDDIYGSSFWGDDWVKAKAQGLSLAGSASFLDTVLARQGIRHLYLTDDDESCAELVSLRTRLDDACRLTAPVMPPVERERALTALAAVTPPLSYVLVPDSAWGQVGASRTNIAQVMAALRWLERHGEQVLAATGTPIAFVTTTRAEAELAEELLGGSPVAGTSWCPTVVALADVGSRRWPVVLWDSVCGPEALRAAGQASIASLMEEVASASTLALIAFVGATWTQGTDVSGQALIEHAACIGRLFSVARVRSSSPDPREKPLSLTALLARLHRRGDISQLVSAAAVNRALGEAGLIERVRDEAGRAGWQPTAAGLEVGIIGATDHEGARFCQYEKRSEAVVARVADDLTPKGETQAQAT